MKENMTLAELQEAQRAEIAKGKRADLELIAEYSEEMSKRINSERESLQTEINELKSKSGDSFHARLSNLNAGKSIQEEIEEEDEDGNSQAFEIEFRFRVRKFAIPGLGEFKAIDILNNPDRYQRVINYLLNSRSSLIFLEKKKPLENHK